MNKVILVGRVVQSPDIRYTQNGKAVCSFSVAVNYQTKVREETDYIDCVAWDTLAETVGVHLVKGRKVVVEGRLHVRRLDGEDGQKRKVTEVVVRDVEFMDRVETA
ncbi:Single-stranded DNA-binding protein A [Sporomusa silvacetica DSM 10669]|uniref:Single-stranded DNA-binding protein n=1 Tax=Sporomusa silvacetica DSM 10669 TaxID=1123289 RepID=A0ABZ3IGN3_9FIRM|nr:single-stranded DNA-binding protein [Sporomusa silvacetica]OZC13105.1 single-stranded DNA-binding protein A [Sporomusa silvacetica DSM 10669]